MMNIKYKKKLASYLFGRWAEKLICLILRLKLYQIIAIRYRNYYGEIDIIALRGKKLIFVEVKARSNYQAEFGLVSYKQKCRIINSAHYFLAKNPQYHDFIIRFDLFIVNRYGLFAHLKSAWDAN